MNGPMSFGPSDRDLDVGIDRDTPSNERSVLVGKLHVAATYLNLHDCHVMGEAVRKAAELLAVETSDDCHGLDNARQVFFYEQDYYVLSNFSAFMVEFGGVMFPTSEHAYHWCKFPMDGLKQRAIQVASSAHVAFKMAERWKQYRREDWDEKKLLLMKDILHAKAAQHEYVARKLDATGDRELIENSWRDDFWGWGPNRDGRNMLGKLWMEVRAERRSLQVKTNEPHSGGEPS